MRRLPQKIFQVIWDTGIYFVFYVHPKVDTLARNAHIHLKWVYRLFDCSYRVIILQNALTTTTILFMHSTIYHPAL